MIVQTMGCPPCPPLSILFRSTRARVRGGQRGHCPPPPEQARQRQARMGQTTGS